MEKKIPTQLISIITASYNSQEFIGKTIESVLDQTYQNWEMIICDDCSTDNSIQIIQNYIEKDSRIKVIRNNANSGAGITRNNAIESANGDYLAFLDSDDLWYPEKLEKQLNFLIDNGYKFSYSYYEQIDEDDKYVKDISTAPSKINYNDLLYENVIGCLTVMIDATFFKDMYMSKIRKRQDYAFWLSLLKKIDFAYCIPEILSKYRVRNNSISRNKFDLLKYNWQLYKNIEGFSTIKASFYLLSNIYFKIFKRK